MFHVPAHKNVTAPAGQVQLPINNDAGFVVRLNRAASPAGVAFIGPEQHSGFSVQDKASAHRFDNKVVAQRYANHFQGWWRGFGDFSPLDIVVEAA
jgi:hypothetical protein